MQRGRNCAHSLVAAAFLALAALAAPASAAPEGCSDLTLTRAGGASIFQQGAWSLCDDGVHGDWTANSQGRPTSVRLALGKGDLSSNLVNGSVLFTMDRLQGLATEQGSLVNGSLAIQIHLTDNRQTLTLRGELPPRYLVQATSTSGGTFDQPIVVAAAIAGALLVVIVVSLALIVARGRRTAPEDKTRRQTLIQIQLEDSTSIAPTVKFRDLILPHTFSNVHLTAEESASISAADFTVSEDFRVISVVPLAKPPGYAVRIGLVRLPFQVSVQDTARGQPIPNVKIIAESIRHGVEVSGVADARGRWEFELPPGEAQFRLAPQPTLSADPTPANIVANGRATIGARLSAPTLSLDAARIEVPPGLPDLSFVALANAALDAYRRALVDAYRIPSAHANAPWLPKELPQQAADALGDLRSEFERVLAEKQIHAHAIGRPSATAAPRLSWAPDPNEVAKLLERSRPNAAPQDFAKNVAQKLAIVESRLAERGASTFIRPAVHLLESGRSFIAPPHRSPNVCEALAADLVAAACETFLDDPVLIAEWAKV